MNAKRCITILLLLAGLSAAGDASAREWKIYDNGEFGYTLKIPAEFSLRTEGKLTTWEFRPPPIAQPPIEESRQKTVNLKLGPLNVQIDDPKRRERVLVDQPSIEQAPLSIAVTWDFLPETPSFTLYKSSRSADENNSRGTVPGIVDIREFDRAQGYDYEGMTYWFREADKSTPDTLHRWVLRSFGNWSVYTVEITGTAAQFAEWGPVFEDVVRSWHLIPQPR